MSRRIAAKDIPELTALRIIAAACVVVSHLHALGMVSAPVLHQILDGGRPAVCFFFVLSGFIMQHNYPLLDAKDSAATKRYAQSRFARLYPTMLLSLGLSVPTVIYLLRIQAHSQLLQYYALQSHYSFWLVMSGVAQLLVLTGWTPAAAINQPWNGPAWSLSCEFFFYASFPFLRPFLQRLSSRRMIVALIVAWLLQGAWIVMIGALAAPNRSSFLIYQFPLTHLFEFASGVCGGILTTRLDARQVRILIASTAVTAVVAFTMLHLWNTTMPDSYGITPLFLALIIATTQSSGSRWFAPLRSRAALALGHASYALYITHIPILIGASVFGVASGIGWFWVPILMAGSLVVHYGYAEPVRRLLLRPASLSPAVALRQ